MNANFSGHCGPNIEEVTGRTSCGFSFSRARARIRFCHAPGHFTARAANTYDIPVIASLTGGGAFLGQEEQQALQILEKTVNKTGGIHGRKVRFVFHDDQSIPTGGPAHNEVVAPQPTVVLGSSLVATCNAMAPLVQNGR